MGKKYDVAIIGDDQQVLLQEFYAARAGVNYGYRTWTQSDITPRRLIDNFPALQWNEWRSRDEDPVAGRIVRAEIIMDEITEVAALRLKEVRSRLRNSDEYEATALCLPLDLIIERWEFLGEDGLISRNFSAQCVTVRSSETRKSQYTGGGNTAVERCGISR